MATDLKDGHVLFLAMSVAAMSHPRSAVFDHAAHGGHVNVSIGQLLEWSRSNSYKHHTLAPIRTETPTADAGGDNGSPLDRIGLTGYTAVPLQPSGILGTIAWIQNPLFSDATPSMRPRILRELATSLQVETDRLSGTKLARKRRRIYDGIGALCNGAPMKDEDALDLFGGLAFLCNLQLVFVQLADSVESAATGAGAGAGAGASTSTSTSPDLHTLSFSSDPRTWSAEIPTWIVEAHGRWIAQPPDGSIVLRRLGAWLSDLEAPAIVGGGCLPFPSKGGGHEAPPDHKVGLKSTEEHKKWVIEWPEAEGTKAEIVDALMDNPAWQPAHAKLLKDALAKKLGRWKSIQHLAVLADTAS